MESVLKKSGLSFQKLEKLSYHSELGISLKRNLHYFDKKALREELTKVTIWYDTCQDLSDVKTDYRIKSIQSACLKYNRYYPDHQARKVFNDLLGFRILCNSYENIFSLQGDKRIRIVDMSKGKANDDGYRGVHVYFQLSNYHYPIEIQYNTYCDRQINDWLHKYVYKKHYANKVGFALRKQYEDSKIRTETEFEEGLRHVLSDC